MKKNFRVSLYGFNFKTNYLYKIEITIILNKNYKQNIKTCLNIIMKLSSV